jgi:hypothetical protein
MKLIDLDHDGLSGRLCDWKRGPGLLKSSPLSGWPQSGELFRRKLNLNLTSLKGASVENCSAERCA